MSCGFAESWLKTNKDCLHFPKYKIYGEIFKNTGMLATAKDDFAQKKERKWTQQGWGFGP